MLQFNPDQRVTADQCLIIIDAILERTPTFSNFLDKFNFDTNGINDEIISINLIEDQDDLTENHDYIQKLPIIQINKRIEMSY